MKEKNLKKFADLAAELAIAHACIEVLEEELQEAKHIIPLDKVEADIKKAAQYIYDNSGKLTALGLQYLLLDLLKEYDHSLELGLAHKEEQGAPGPKVIRDGSVEVKTTGQLIDELIIMNQRIWALIDKVIAGVATPEEAQNVQKYNAKRNEYVRAIDSRLNNAIQFDPNAPEPSNFLGAKVYGR